MDFHPLKDLDRFINGEITWEEIQGIYHDRSVKWLMVDIFTEACYYSKDEHDLFEKLCYANVLRINDLFKDTCDYYYTYAKYLYAKDVSFPHKMGWDILLEKIIKETHMSELDIKLGKDYYKTYQETGSWPCDDDYDY